MPAPPELKTVAISELLPNPKNDRVHPEEQLTKLVASIDRFGQPRPVLARKANSMLIAGHAVHMAMLRAGRPEIEVLLWDVDQATADAFLEADNRFGELSESDPGRRRALLRELGRENVASIGYSEKEFDKLISAAGDAIPVVEVDTSEVADDFWILVRGPLAGQAAALQKLRGVMAEIEGVSVELGTTPR